MNRLACPPRPELVNNGFADRVIVPALVSVAAATTGNPVTVRMPTGKGKIIGMRGCTQKDGTALGMSSLALQIKVGSSALSLVTTGDAAAFANFATLFGLDGSCMFPLMRDASREEDWEFTVKNYHAVNAYVPELSLFYFATP